MLRLCPVVITGHGKIKSSLFVPNDCTSSAEQLIQTYTRRWLVEKGFSEPIYCFRLNRVSSSIVIKVEYDRTTSIPAHNP